MNFDLSQPDPTSIRSIKAWGDRMATYAKEIRENPSLAIELISASSQLHGGGADHNAASIDEVLELSLMALPAYEEANGRLYARSIMNRPWVDFGPIEQLDRLTDQ